MSASVQTQASDPQSNLRVQVFLVIAAGLWLLSLVRGIAASFQAEAIQRTVGEMRIADERIVICSAIGLIVAVGISLWIQGFRPGARPRLFAALTLGAFTTGVIGAMEATQIIPSWSQVRPGWAGVWLVFFPLVLCRNPLHSVIAVGASVVLHVGARLLALSGDTDWSIELASAAAMVVVGCFVLLPGETVRVLRRERPDRLGDYELQDRLGAGGMGEVYRASHRFLRRQAAVKRIAPDGMGSSRMLGSPDFEREAQITASLRSPHSVELYDFGVDDNGELYYVMELLHGIDLRALVERFGYLPSERVAHLLLQCTDALGEAHEAKLLHRDLKPANLFACAMNRRVDHLKVLDFGLAAVAGTVRGLAGTPGYLAPELQEGAPASTATDMYALGCVARWLCTGQSPDEGTPGISASFADAYGIDPALCGLIDDLLADDPQDRPSADELAARLHATGLATSWTRARAMTWWRQHLPEAAAAAGVRLNPNEMTNDGERDAVGESRSPGDGDGARDLLPQGSRTAAAGG